MRRSLSFLLLLTILVVLPLAAYASDYIVGVDVSFMRQAELGGVVFKDNHQPMPGLQIFRNHGYNWVRIRLFHDPAAVARDKSKVSNDLSYVIAFAKDAKARGFKYLLDFHYADTWAGPNGQPIPAAWKNMSHAELVTALREYNRDTVKALRDAGVMPDMIQLGHETTNGMLWPDGKLFGRGSTPEGWSHFLDFLKAAREGIREGTGDAPAARIMINIDRPCDKAFSQDYFDKVVAAGVQFDIIGQSYFPRLHGSLLDLRENLAFMAERYNKDIMIAEGNYAWLPSDYVNSPSPYPETPEGQRAFLEAVNEVVMSIPNHRGIGLFWWEAAVAPTHSFVGHSMFDKDANALPVINVFDRWGIGTPQKTAGK